MKIIALGDIHGRPVWKSIVENETFDKIVFIGDYFDSKEGISGKDQRKNFKDIIHFKKSHPDKVVLLIGNHDYHYLKYVYQTYSGFQAFEQPAIQELLEDAISENLLQICYRWENFLFTHAGVTRHWFSVIFEKEFSDKSSLEDTLNDLFKTKRTAFGFMQGPMCEPNGDNSYQSPIWVRPYSLSLGMIDGFIQVVGHTIRPKIMPYQKDAVNGIVEIDTLGTSGEYLVIENGTIIPTLNRFNL
jgi:hypothetical protein